MPSSRTSLAVGTVAFIATYFISRYRRQVKRRRAVKWISELLPLGEKIVVSGPCGAGKSTVSDRLSALLPASPHVELDALHWNEDWLPTGDAEFRDRVRVMLGSLHGWVVDGNYRVVRGVIWPQADTFVWLDLPRLVTIPRVLRRTLGRVVSGRELWGKRGTVERWNNVLFSSDSIIYWAWIGKTKQRSQFPVELAKPEYTGLKVVRLRDPVEVEVFLELIAEGGQRTNVEFSSLD